tara:strand:+ start:1110 stop:1505 length:396 start_codon:yes stop_codon:yes gene_type:complete
MSNYFYISSFMHIQVIKHTLFSILAYDETSITINEQKYSQSVFITSENALKLEENFPTLDKLTLSHLPSLENINLLLVGGKHLTPLSIPITLKNELYSHNTSLEIMSIGAACRTFNLLLSEGRDVACLIFL